MKKFLIPIIFGLVLIGAGLATWALTSDGGDTTQSRAVSGHSAGHVVVRLPPVTTTTQGASATSVATTTTTSSTQPVTPVIAVAPKSVPTPVTPSTTLPPNTTTTPSAPKTVTAVAPTTGVTVQTTTTGVMTAPDGSACSAGVYQECVLVTSPLVSGVRSSFSVTGASGVQVGTFTADDQPYDGYGQTSCLIHWMLKTSVTIASSADCSGGPLTSDQSTFDFNYSAAS